MLYGLKGARVRANMTLDALAQKSEKDRNTISRLENLRRGADLKTVHALARGLGVTPEEIIGEP